MKTNITIQEPKVKAIPNAEISISVGDWYWLESKGEERLMCLIEMGSNYYKLRSKESIHRGYFYERVHIDEFDKRCRKEENAEQYISDQIDKCREKSKRLMIEVQKLSQSLGVTPIAELETGSNDSALMVLNGTNNIEKYKADLVKAKTDKLPKLFKEIKDTNTEMATWMKALVIPFEATADKASKVVDKIEDRIFNVELYAGLTETVERIKDGKPAGRDDKLHVMQRRLYMDEECLLKYEAGGMRFDDIGDFDEWLCKDGNFNRILPFNKCLVAFKVRFYENERYDDSENPWIRFNMKQKDNLTFLYIRNGEQLYRLNTELEFAEKIFPDASILDSEEVRAYRRWNKIECFITEHDFQERKKKSDEYRKIIEDWKKENQEVILITMKAK